ncbi:TonB-dependent receptor [Opitutus sp. GAS368]|uniref:TonB-dependent receptor n=1 Tax=Opitutus sp. GAS368 TaxID=1882749 RepID=UPI0008799E94|nr:TonB-dependent receptor [Opitutus sp. GAS368]SDS07673.1 Outer membrane cobalamin receptor protein [Opitutus sp. GAS368]
MKPAARYLAVLLLTPALRAQTVTLDPVAVTAARAAQPAAAVPFSLAILGGDTLRATPAVTLDGALRSVPGFSLFRRSDSLTANPTAQGVSLRGLGPSGASRSLVLLDGVPLNDPFGGWVIWSKVPRESLAGAELVRGGGATAWGNAALGGVVQLLTEKKPSNLIGYKAPAASGGRLAATAGDFSTRSVELALSQSAGPGTLELSGRDFATDGFNLVAAENRGPVDIAAWSRHHWMAARWTQPVGENATLTVTGRTFAEARGNGTPYQQNSSRENLGSVALTARPDKNFSWTALAYAQDQTFSSTFSSVNATRTAETPASDQFAVPASALGAAWTGSWTHSGDARTSAGVDFRRVRGETRENFTFSAGDFTRQRVAGGTQEFAGLFALHERALAPDWHLTLGARLDDWREADGHRRETDRATGAVLRDDHYADRDGLEFSPSAGLVWTPAPAWRVRAAAQQAFRRPTLNELYRPFRAGNVITEANADLQTERVTSTELGADYTHGTLTLGSALFWNELHDAVGNVTIAHGPGTFPIVGFIPAGGTGRERLNLDRLRVRGLELTAGWRPTPALSFDVAYLYDDALVRRATLAPALVGKRLAQVPRHGATLGASWRTGRLTLTPRVRVIGRQFEDDENLLILGTAVIADLGASCSLGRGEVFLTIENLGNARVETGRSTDGIVNTGTPRLALAGFRSAW